jgi:hypothetical protein
MPRGAEWKAMDGMISLMIVFGLTVALMWLAHRALPDNDSSR